MQPTFGDCARLLRLLLMLGGRHELARVTGALLEAVGDVDGLSPSAKWLRVSARAISVDRLLPSAKGLILGASRAISVDRRTTSIAGLMSAF